MYNTDSGLPCNCNSGLQKREVHKIILLTETAQVLIINIILELLWSVVSRLALSLEGNLCWQRFLNISLMGLSCWWLKVKNSSVLQKLTVISQRQHLWAPSTVLLFFEKKLAAHGYTSWVRLMHVFHGVGVDCLWVFGFNINNSSNGIIVCLLTTKRSSAAK